MGLSYNARDIFFKSKTRGKSQQHAGAILFEWRWVSPYSQGQIQKILEEGWNLELGWMLTKSKKVRPKKGVNKPFEKCIHV